MNKRGTWILTGVAIIAGVFLGGLIPGLRLRSTTGEPPVLREARAPAVTVHTRSRSGHALPHRSPTTAPRLPAPRLPSTPADDTPAEQPLPPLKALQDGTGGIRPSDQQVEAYLRENQRSADSLLAAASIAGNSKLRREAVDRFPKDPSALLQSILYSDSSPEERRVVLDAFCQATPDNALGDYLSALQHFQTGDSDGGVHDMVRALEKPWMDDYFLELVQSREELYVAAGLSRERAAVVAAMEAPVPQIGKLRELSRHLLALEELYAAQGDFLSAGTVAEFGIILGEQIQDQLGHLLVNNLSGIAIERGFLERLEPSAVLAKTGQTVAERLMALDQYQRAMSETCRDAGELLANADDRVLMNYVQRAKLYGELAALRWLQERRVTSE